MTRSLIFVATIFLAATPVLAKPVSISGVSIIPTVETLKTFPWRLTDIGKPPKEIPEEITFGIRAEGVTKGGTRYRLSVTPNPKKIISFGLKF
jgi:hypothetical protein